MKQKNAQRGRPTQQMDTHETITNVKNNLLVLSREQMGMGEWDDY